MNCRMAAAQDRACLSALWQQCFGDGPETVALYFDRAWQPDRLALAEVAGTPVAMAAWFPVRWAGAWGAYLYAVCTAPAWRGQGICRSLMAWLEAWLAGRGAAFAALRPGETSLFRFYAALGYETRLFSRQLPLAPAPAAGSLEPVTPRAYCALRRSLLPSGQLELDEAFCAYQAVLSAASGGGLYRVCLPAGGGCAAVERYGSQLAVKELLLEQPARLEQAGALLLRQLSASGGWARTIPQPAQPGSAFGMVRPLSAQFTLPAQAYLGLAFD